MSKYFTAQGELNDIYMQIPKAFFVKESQYFSMSANAKLLYALLKDRNKLSIENNWVDSQDRIYFIFSQNEISELMGKDLKTIRNILKELEKFELLERKRNGVNMVDWMYLLQLDIPETVENTLMGKNSLSRRGKIPYQEGEKFPTNKNNINNKYVNEINKGEKPPVKEGKKYKGFEAIINDYTDNIILRETIVKFIKHRFSLGKKIVDMSLMEILKELDKIAANDKEKIEILNTSIANGYSGVFALKKEKPKKNNKTKELKFNNFTPREYDYNDLENKLLGWNDENNHQE